MLTRRAVPAASVVAAHVRSHVRLHVRRHVRFRVFRLLPVALTAMLLPATIQSQATASPRPDSILATTLMQDLVRVARLPGLSVAALEQGRVRFARGAGYRDLSRRLPVDSSTRFGSASVSKVVMATAALRMMQDGRFDPDQPVSAHFPDFPGAAAITPRLLAAHLGGIPHYGPGSMPSDKRHVWASAALDEFSKARRVGAPGERSVYSTHGITLLSAVLEQRAKQPILDLLAREVFVPFDMPSSGGLFVDSLSPRMALLYARQGDSLRALPGPRNLSFAWAGAGLLQTPSDLVRMTRAYFDGQLSAATLSTAFTEQRTNAGVGTGVAFVWRVEQDWRGRPLAHHAGANPGTRSVLLMRRNEGRSLALMTNVEWTASMDGTANVLLEALFNSAPRRQALRLSGRWQGTYDSTAVEGEWVVNGDSGWVSTPEPLRARFLQSGGVGADRLPLRAIRDDLYAVVTPWGLYTLEVTERDARQAHVLIRLGTQRWTLRSR